MRSHFSISPLRKIPTEFPKPKPGALHCLTEKATWCFWSCLLRMAEGKGEKQRTEKEESSFLHPVQQLMHWSCNKNLERKDRACWWWIPEDCKASESREQEALEDLVHKPCYSTRCDRCGWGKAVAMPARPETNPCLYSQHWGERRQPRLRWVALTNFLISNSQYRKPQEAHQATKTPTSWASYRLQVSFVDLIKVALAKLCWWQQWRQNLECATQPRMKGGFCVLSQLMLPHRTNLDKHKHCPFPQ